MIMKTALSTSTRVRRSCEEEKLVYGREGFLGDDVFSFKFRVMDEKTQTRPQAQAEVQDDLVNGESSRKKMTNR